jgi:hypothetical protein
MQVKRRKGISKNLTRRHNGGLLLYSVNQREAFLLIFRFFPLSSRPVLQDYRPKKLILGSLAANAISALNIAILDSIIFADAWK